MPTNYDFEEYYKTISNTELLNILDNSTEYQPAAVEAARLELSRRQLSETEIYEAKKPLIEKQLRVENQKEKLQNLEIRVKNSGRTLLDTLNPIETGLPSTEKIIRLVVIVYTVLFLYQFISDFDFFVQYIRNLPEFLFRSLLLLFQLIILPVAIFCFWKRKSSGWILLTIFLTYSSVSAAWLLVQVLLWGPAGNPGFVDFFPGPSISEVIIPLIFFLATQYTISRQRIRSVFSINDSKMATVIGISAGLSFFLVYANS